ncbi:MAG: hypothetical protein J6N95_01390 [Bacilli bacterium]|nr:hypothetical protein [Bacilli bacterium]
MKKEDVIGIIIYLIIIALAVVFGFTVLQTHQVNSAFQGMLYYLFVFLSVIIGVLFNSILFELAHIAGAKAGKYEILSVTILYFSFFKENGKFKFRFSSFDGLTGETKIVPKKGYEDKANPTPYLIFGSLFFVVEAIIVMVIFTLFKDKGGALGDLAYGFLTVGAIGLVILFYNIVPLKIDSMTDGYRLTMVSNPKNKAAFNELLRVEHEIQQGNTDVEVKLFDDITNFTADLNLNKVYALLDKKEYKEAEEILDKIIAAKENIDAKVFIRARAQKIYINLITKDLEEAKEYYEKEVPVSERREISNDVSMASIRAYLLMSGLLDKSRSECIIALNNVYRAFKKTPKNRQATEVTLFNEALDRVIAAHADWELEGYKLQIASK